ncbi:unnamed protein product [Didymodactylos carnosus]|uniref:Uncharacterized protein n=1 Tax=Didymodactylos carnosus TaxID=1234261 RepID=A0A815TTA5_9BILA|nr:unnamed protein product [Didymodactylos carnosus]CAF4367584.1 unnamed protein product [Didymodactylos carnosus]
MRKNNHYNRNSSNDIYYRHESRNESVNSRYERYYSDRYSAMSQSETACSSWFENEERRSYNEPYYRRTANTNYSTNAYSQQPLDHSHSEQSHQAHTSNVKWSQRGLKYNHQSSSSNYDHQPTSSSSSSYSRSHYFSPGYSPSTQTSRSRVTNVEVIDDNNAKRLKSTVTAIKKDRTSSYSEQSATASASNMKEVNKAPPSRSTSNDKNQLKSKGSPSKVVKPKSQLISKIMFMSDSLGAGISKVIPAQDSYDFHPDVLSGRRWSGGQQDYLSTIKFLELATTKELLDESIAVVFLVVINQIRNMPAEQVIRDVQRVIETVEQNHPNIESIAVVDCITTKRTTARYPNISDIQMNIKEYNESLSTLADELQFTLIQSGITVNDIKDNNIHIKEATNECSATIVDKTPPSPSTPRSEQSETARTTNVEEDREEEKKELDSSPNTNEFDDFIDIIVSSNEFDAENKKAAIKLKRIERKKQMTPQQRTIKTKKRTKRAKKLVNKNTQEYEIAKGWTIGLLNAVLNYHKIQQHRNPYPQNRKWIIKFKNKDETECAKEKLGESPFSAGVKLEKSTKRAEFNQSVNSPYEFQDVL